MSAAQNASAEDHPSAPPAGRNCAFVVATYGARYAPFIYAFLDSLARSYPDPEVLLLYSRTPAEDIAAFHGLSPRLTARDIGSAGATQVAERRSTSEALDQAISRKLRYWGEALHETRAEIVAFCDTDLLVLQKFDHFLEDGDDLVITYLPKGTLLNSGLVLCRNVPAVRHFFSLWRDLTEEILASPERARAAAERNGGADQDSLVSLLGYGRQTARFTVRLPGGEEIRVRPVPCAMLNEIRCTPVTSDKHIFHLKGRWHPIVLDGGPFGKTRPLESCQAIMQLWLDCFASGARRGMAGLLAQLAPTQPAASDGHQLALGLAAASGAKRVLVPIPLEDWPVAPGGAAEALINRLNIEAAGMALELLPVSGRSGMRRQIAAQGAEPYGLVLGDVRIGAPHDIFLDAMAAKGPPPLVMSFPTAATQPPACFRFAVVPGAGMAAGEGDVTIWAPGALDVAFTIRKPTWLSVVEGRPLCTGDGHDVVSPTAAASVEPSD